MSEADPFDLARFVEAQQASYAQALEELRAGRKRTHWMWYVFPQLAGLGRSFMAERYAIGNRAQAQAYLAHPVLGARLAECAEALLGIGQRSAHQVMGSPDDLKLRSSMTLFAQVAPPGSVFERVLARYFEGEPDPVTLRLLGAGP